MNTHDLPGGDEQRLLRPAELAATPKATKRVDTPAPSEPVRLIRADELAAILNVTTRTVNDWARNERIPSIRISFKTRRFDLDAVVRVLAERWGGAA